MSRMAEIARSLERQRADPRYMKEAQALVARRAREAKRIVKDGVDVAGARVVARMRPISSQAAIVVKELIARGIPPGQAVKAAAHVAEWKFLRQTVPYYERRSADLSTAPTQLYRRDIAREF